MGAWLLKFAAFLGLAVALRDSVALDPVVLFLSLVAAAVGTVAADVVAVLRSRVPYIEPALPTPAVDSTSGA